MKIGIDIDDVVFEFVRPFIGMFNSKYDGNVSFEEIYSYSLWEPLKISKEDAELLLEELLSEDLILNMEFCFFAKEVIRDLLENNEINFVTSRVYREGTLESLQKHFSDFELHFSSNPYLKSDGKTKSEICLENGINVMIEDSPEHSLDCAEAGIRVLLLDKPWNKNCEHENIIRVGDWNEIKEKIGVLG